MIITLNIKHPHINYLEFRGMSLTNEMLDSKSQGCWLKISSEKETTFVHEMSMEVNGDIELQLLDKFKFTFN